MQGGRRHLSYRAVCPGCGGDSMEVQELYDDIPGLGNAVLIAMFCPGCGMKAHHEIPLESKGIRKVEFRVSDRKALNARVIRSPSGRILVPELGLELTPGPRSLGFVTNVEGVLERFLEVAEQLAGLEEGPKKEKAEQTVRRIRSAIEGSLPFTLVIEDEQGNSAIIPQEGNGVG
ncbi:MAG: ZPR1 zinc finger domain-containing protein [Candidatus Verstraetearchaeota archaeon]|nr:ZPR1 zinc finger domain-containing protein [Candidatus Verstraetearchaeota archaeon]